MHPLDLLQARLARERAEHRERRLMLRRGVDLCSNDYLGFADDPELRVRIASAVADAPAGAAGSRLLRGHLEIHGQVERELAAFCGRSAAVLLPSGYQANLALLGALLTPRDQVFVDERIHASLRDAVALSGARKVLVPHNDLAALADRLGRQRVPGKEHLTVLVTESLFSMDGDRADLHGWAKAAEEHNALLVVDEAHATGLWGNGAGLVQEAGLADRVFATVHTGGKALGVGGAWIAGGADLPALLTHFARPFIFSTAVAPPLAVSLREAVRHWRAQGAPRAAAVLARAAALRTALLALARDLGRPPSCLDALEGAAGPVLPWITGDAASAVAAAGALQERGLDARAIRHPTVAKDTARLRFTVTWNVGAPAWDDALATLRTLALAVPVQAAP